MDTAKPAAALIAAILLLSALPARAQTAEQDEYQKAVAELEALERKSAQIAAQYEIALVGLDRLQAELTDLRGRVAELETRADDSQTDINAFTILTYKFGSPTVNDFDLLVRRGSLDDVVRARKYLDTARGAGRRALARWQGSTQALSVESTRLQAVEKQHEDLLVELRDSREELEAITARQLEVVDTAKEKLDTARLTAQIASLKGRVPVPPELAAFGNGRIPASALTSIGIGSHRLWHPAAVAFIQMYAVAAEAGVEIGVTDSYRSYEAQVDVAARKGLYKNGGLAATPGTSNHGWGLALDLDLDWPAQQWMRANAGQFGFVEDVPREPWHWTFHGGG